MLITSIIIVCVLFGLLSSGLWIAISLGVTAAVGVILSQSAEFTQVLATSFWGASNSWELAALPLFIWMGDILVRSKMSSDLFDGLSPWLSRVPGRLLHITVLASAIFAAVSGSSTATAATVGKIAIPELEQRKYNLDIAIGSLAGSGTLGLLIPPSIIMIVYGVVSRVSIAQLFIAGIIPGILVAMLYMGYIAIWSIIHKDKMPQENKRYKFLEKIRATYRLLPTIILILVIIGTIYTGLASPTDAAALGVVAALLIAFFEGTLNRQVFVDGLLSAIKTSAMIGFLLLSANFLTVAMGYLGLPQELAMAIDSLNLERWQLLIVLTIFFIFLGCFIDGISIVVLTASIILPMVQISGIDLLWFGIYLVIVVEMSSVTPPVGFNLFVIQNLAKVSLWRASKAVLPFFIGLIVAVALISWQPILVTWLPSLMLG